MAPTAEPQPRIGLLWRGDRQDEPHWQQGEQRLGSLLEAFAKLPVDLEPVVFEDNAVEEVRKQLLSLDGVLVWVNPIQDGANRAQLDTLLREAAAHGVWVSAHPDVILKLGTKEVLFHTRELGWGSDTDIYHSFADFEHCFPRRLIQHDRLVIKQGRGNGGNGVWKVELIGPRGAPDDATVRVMDALSRDGSSEKMALSSFMQRCEDYFAWSGCIVDQMFQERLVDGMLRCYFVHDEVVGFCHQWPRGLLDVDPTAPAVAPPAVTVIAGPDAPAYQALRAMAGEWVPQMMGILGIERDSLPVIWDADFLYGPKDESGEDTYVLCEINVSAVWPFPPMASDKIAAAALARTLHGRVEGPARSGGARNRQQITRPLRSQSQEVET